MTPEMFKAQQARLGLSNSKMAKALGVTVSYVDKLRSGARKINKRTEIIITLLMDKPRKM